MNYQKLVKLKKDINTMREVYAEAFEGARKSEYGGLNAPAFQAGEVTLTFLEHVISALMENEND